MSEKLTIGNVAKRTGLPAKTIRFYEDEGLIPPPRRSESGYRLYSDADVLRLQVIRRARMLGLDLPTINSLVEQSFSADCASFGEQLLETIERQRREVQRRIEELQALSEELGRMRQHVIHSCEGCSPAELASQCGFCFFISDLEGGENDAVNR